MKKFMCIDTETTGLDWTTCVLHGLSVGYAEDQAIYYPKWDIPIKIIEDLANPEIPKLGHNLHGYDAKVLQRADYVVAGELHDTMIVYNLIDDSSALGLKYLSDLHLGIDSLDSKRELDRYISQHGAGNIAGLCAKDLADPSHPHLKVIAEYCNEDCRNTISLFLKGMKKLQEMDTVLKGPKFGFKKSPLDYYFEEAMPLERVLFEMEYRGIRVDLTVMERIRDAATARMATIETILNTKLVNRIRKLEEVLYEREVSKKVTDKAKAKVIKSKGKVAFSWGNNNHVGELLFAHCGLEPDLIQTTEKGKFKTDKEALETLRTLLPAKHGLQRVLTLFSEYKLHAKIASTYTGTNKKGIMSKVRYKDSIPRIYPNYRQTTGTGRLASNNPNMQNLKRDSEVKKFFIPDNENEVIDDADYSQVELRTGAHLSQDSGLLRAYRNKEDVHLRTASRIFRKNVTKADDIERQAGKRTNFLTIFDGGPYRLQTCLKQDTGKDFTIEQCKEFIQIWFETYPDVRAYLDAELEFFKKFRFCISETGRVRRLPDIIFGIHLKWIKTDDGRWSPKFTGSPEKRNELVSDLKKRGKKISEESIGWQAKKRYNHAIKAGYNQPIQGLAASMTKRSMIELHKLGRNILNQVHDSLSVTRDKDNTLAKEQLVTVMKDTYPLSLPVEVDVKTLRSLYPKDIVK